MAFVAGDGARTVEMLPGVRRKTLGTGERMMLCEIRLEPGAVVPTHDHPHEQVGYVVSGRVQLRAEGEGARLLGPGDSYAVPGGVPHEAEALEETVLVEVFSPPREEYR